MGARGVPVPILLLALGVACAPAMRSTIAGTPDGHRMAEFWVAPDGDEARDLIYGAGGQKDAPRPSDTDKRVKAITHGFSPKMEVEDPSGTKWDVKMGDEAQTEVVASRIVWALGYHQPPDYYLSTWTWARRSAKPGSRRRGAAIPDAFEKAGFISGVTGGRVLFDFHGRHHELLTVVHPEDVRWTCARLGRLSSRQWHDAFRAGGYDDQTTERFLRKIHEKIAQGAAMGQGPRGGA
jgi:hypothetical protein